MPYVFILLLRRLSPEHAAHLQVRQRHSRSNADPALTGSPEKNVAVTRRRRSTDPDKPCTATPPPLCSAPVAASTGCIDTAYSLTGSALPTAPPAPAPPADCHPPRR